LIRFAMSHRWELVHQWLEADLDHNFGLTLLQWQAFQAQMNSQQSRLLEMKQAGATDGSIAQALGCTVIQVQKQWSKLLEQAWEIRNGVVSGSRISTDE